MEHPILRIEWGLMFKHILITLDGSPYGERVIPYVVDLAALVEASVTLMTAIPDGVGPEPYQSYLNRQAAHLRDEGLGDVQVDVVAGASSPALAIVDAARRLSADLIVMATQGESAKSDQGLGSVAAAVLVSAPCPVFLVRVQRPQPPRTPSEERWQSEGGANVG